MLSSVSPIEQTWASFKTKRTSTELYSEDAVVMYVPTCVGVRGNAQIRKFFLNSQFSEKVNPVQETVYNTVVGSHQLIEEVIWSIHFHTGECKWLVPHLEERYLVIINMYITNSPLFSLAHPSFFLIR